MIPAWGCVARTQISGGIVGIYPVLLNRTFVDSDLVGSSGAPGNKIFHISTAVFLKPSTMFLAVPDNRPGTSGFAKLILSVFFLWQQEAPG